MRPLLAGLTLSAVLLLAPGGAPAEDPPLPLEKTPGFEKVDLAALQKDCRKELKKWCRQITPGGGRVLACLYAHEDQLSDKCVFGLYEQAVELEKAIVQVKFAGMQCRNELLAFCADVEVGEGRALACLDRHWAEVGKPCKDALRETGLKK
jgi:hypothetical protein